MASVISVLRSTYMWLHRASVSRLCAHQMILSLMRRLASVSILYARRSTVKSVWRVAFGTDVISALKITTIIQQWKSA